MQYGALCFIDIETLLVDRPLYTPIRFSLYCPLIGQFPGVWNHKLTDRQTNYLLENYSKMVGQTSARDILKTLSSRLSVFILSSQFEQEAATKGSCCKIK